MLFVAFLCCFWLSLKGLALAADTTVFQTVSACSLNVQNTTPGFKVLLYEYPYGTSMYTQPGFMTTGYMSRSLLQSYVTTDVFYDHFNGVHDAQTDLVTLPNGVVFNSAHFLFEYTGYFVPPSTGLYKFVLFKVDDAVTVFLGQGAFDCCASDAEGSVSQESLLSVHYLNSAPQDGESGWVFLEQGYFFPLRIVYVNIEERATLNFVVVDPQNNSINNFEHLIFSPEFTGDCSATVITQQTVFTSTDFTAVDTTTISGTSTQSNSITYPVETVVVPPTTTTITSGSILTTYETTFSDDTTTFPGNVVVTPYPVTTITSGTATGISTYFSTLTDATTTFTGEVVVVPYPVTTITSGTATEISTYFSTLTDATTTFTGEVVVVPYPVTTITSGTATEISTYFSTLTDATTTFTGEVVVVPYPVTTITSGTATGISTYFSTLTDATTTFTGEVVVVPYPVTTITSGTATGISTYFSTLTDATTTFTGEVVVVPYPVTTITSGTATGISTYFSTLTDATTTFTGEVVVVPYPVKSSPILSSSATRSTINSSNLSSSSATTSTFTQTSTSSTTPSASPSASSSTSSSPSTSLSPSKSYVTVTYTRTLFDSTITKFLTSTVVVPCEATSIEASFTGITTSLKTNSNGEVDSALIVAFTTNRTAEGSNGNATATATANTVTRDQTAYSSSGNGIATDAVATDQAAEGTGGNVATTADGSGTIESFTTITVGSSNPAQTFDVISIFSSSTSDFPASTNLPSFDFNGGGHNAVATPLIFAGVLSWLVLLI